MSTKNQGIYVVTGATGNIGRRLAERLLEAGRRVRVIARDETKLAALAAKGAEVRRGSLEDEAFLVEAFRGAAGVFAMIPPNYGAADMRAYQNQVGTKLAAALRKAGVTHVVSLSSVGAQLTDGTGPIKGLHDQEKRLDAIPELNVLHLRPAFFMENLLHQVPLIQSMGIVGSPLRGDARLPMIATQDIAEVAAKRLLELDFTGKQVAELLGQRDLSMEDVAAAFAKRLGRPGLKYVAFPYEAAEKSMVEIGMSRDSARNMNEMYRGFNDGAIQPTQGRSAKTTTPTTIEAFSETIAKAVGA